MLPTLIRISAFLRKEIFEIVRQPRLVLTLVAGPFLILLLFGVGYRNANLPLRTLFVVAPNTEIERRINEYAPQFANAFTFMGTTDDERAAFDRLRLLDVELVVVAPSDPYGTIRRNEHPTFTLYHNEIDPLRVGYVGFVGQLYIDEINRLILRLAARQGQQDAAQAQGYIRAATESLKALSDAFARGDVDRAQKALDELQRPVDELQGAIDPTVSYLDAIAEMLDDQSAKNDDIAEVADVQNALSDIRMDVLTISSARPGQRDYATELEALRRLETRLSELGSKLAQFRSLTPEIIVRPLLTDAKSISAHIPSITDYYGPAVIVLLLQHLMVTFAALSLVRERQGGTLELFRAAPLSAFETLTGKYVSYFVMGVFIEVLLFALLRFGLGVPMLGSWLDLAIVIGALLFAGLGIGFFISVIAQTDSQAVQFSMLVLLAAVFFAGAFLNLQTLWEPIRIVSWMLPATYAIQLLQTVMLRGFGMNPLLIGGLAAMGAALFALNLVLLHRQMRRE